MVENFKKLLPEDRENVLQRALKENAVFVFKSPQKPIKAKICSLKRPNYITCVRPTDIVSLRTREDIIVVLVLEEERYFFKTFAFVDEGELHFKRKVDFYHLVRRKNKRFRFPANYEATFMIKRLNGALSFLRGIMSDFSDIGCRVSLITDLPKIKVDDEVIGNLKIGGNRSVEVTAVVKHHEYLKSGKVKQTFGLKFVFSTTHSKNMVKSLFIDIQRELFAEFYGKK